MTIQSCEECGRYLTDDIEAQNTLCNRCAAIKYWALKAHIRNKLQLYARLPKPKLNVSDMRLLAQWANANYVNGVAFERRLKHLLEDAGYYVMRSAGSHGAADLIAIKGKQVYLIQCKPDWRSPEKEKEALLKVCNDTAHFTPIHAYSWQRRLHIIDMRTGNEVELFGEGA